jgi:hypothetical protein
VSLKHQKYVLLAHFQEEMRNSAMSASMVGFTIFFTNETTTITKTKEANNDSG